MRKARSEKEGEKKVIFLRSVLHRGTGTLMSASRHKVPIPHVLRPVPHVLRAEQ